MSGTGTISRPPGKRPPMGNGVTFGTPPPLGVPARRCTQSPPEVRQRRRIAEAGNRAPWTTL